ncbi:MAG: HipA N-terminal domain-containing protein [Myxococcales bacterium]|nr:HipA N-terminal domain-containing protein [Myxococcales bacterium]
MTADRTIEVFADWVGLGGPQPLGHLHATVSRGKEVFAFEFAPTWLERPDIPAVDPALPVFGGRQYPRRGHANFGVFLDSCPDRWGRVLMRRREARSARKEGRAERRLLESDYLLGVFDRHRMGAMRFRLDPEGRFLDDHEGLAAPPWTSLRALEQASRALEADDAESDPAFERAGVPARRHRVNPTAHAPRTRRARRPSRASCTPWTFATSSASEASSIARPASKTSSSSVTTTRASASRAAAAPNSVASAPPLDCSTVRSRASTASCARARTTVRCGASVASRSNVG